MDYRSLHLGFPREEDANLVSFDLSPEYLESLILQGENEVLEFKEVVKGGALGDEFLESIVAFANNRGGRILVGVKDDCRVTGVTNADVVENSIQNLIRAKCDPPIRVNVKAVVVDNLQVLAVEVPNGDNKPYVLRDKGPYVRAGGSDRSMLRAELDAIYQARSHSANPWGWPIT
ncbi:MAG: ATP-binding protein [Chloroflexota bacterium]|nr:ATP-binding protein [Chloroflexota bacterium]